jgi:radical SAM protein (TIGR01212 family)
MNKKRYNDFNTYLRGQFGCRVQKITLDAGFSCPNRDGTFSHGGCIYCDGRGSGTGAHLKGESIREQVVLAKSRLASRYKAKKFMAYFQAYTNTYGTCEILRARYDAALADPDVVGLAIGTRPDCVDESKLDLIQEYTKTHMVWIEYGLQSMHNQTLRKINRGHTFEDFALAVQMTQGRNILVCAHVILGLPGESRQDILETARVLSRLELDGVKIHSLYVVEQTPLAALFRKGAYRTLDQNTYVEWVTVFLERISPKVVIQRLTGDPDPSTLLAPAWALRKQETLSLIQKSLEVEDTWQGRLA